MTVARVRAFVNSEAPHIYKQFFTRKFEPMETIIRIISSGSAYIGAVYMGLLFDVNHVSLGHINSG